ncbi:hypothetical protein D3C81_1663890 [compost metagenome]
MKQVWLALSHRILIVTEGGKTELKKVLPELLGLVMSDRVVKGIDYTVMVGKALTYQGHNCRSDRVMSIWRRDRPTQARRQSLTIVAIKIPGTSGRASFRFQQQATTLAHSPIEVLHSQVLAASGPTREGFART